MLDISLYWSLYVFDSPSSFFLSFLFPVPRTFRSFLSFPVACSPSFPVFFFFALISSLPFSSSPRAPPFPRGVTPASVSSVLFAVVAGGGCRVAREGGGVLPGEERDRGGGEGESGREGPRARGREERREGRGETRGENNYTQTFDHTLEYRTPHISRLRARAHWPPPPPRVEKEISTCFVKQQQKTFVTAPKKLTRKEVSAFFPFSLSLGRHNSKKNQQSSIWKKT